MLLLPKPECLDEALDVFAWLQCTDENEVPTRQLIFLAYRLNLFGCGIQFRAVNAGIDDANLASETCRRID